MGKGEIFMKSLTRSILIIFCLSLFVLSCSGSSSSGGVEDEKKKEQEQSGEEDPTTTGQQGDPGAQEDPDFGADVNYSQIMGQLLFNSINLSMKTVVPDNNNQALKKEVVSLSIVESPEYDCQMYGEGNQVLDPNAIQSYDEISYQRCEAACNQDNSGLVSVKNVFSLEGQNIQSLDANVSLFSCQQDLCDSSYLLGGDVEVYYGFAACRVSMTVEALVSNQAEKTIAVSGSVDISFPVLEGNDELGACFTFDKIVCAELEGSFTVGTREITAAQACEYMLERVECAVGESSQ
jgi:hypothetical protein